MFFYIDEQPTKMGPNEPQTKIVTPRVPFGLPLYPLTAYFSKIAPQPFYQFDAVWF